MSIHLLPEIVAARIAAGEVVERPASVVKELTENSLDAGATRVEVETRQGGQALIRVRDDGHGILGQEVALAFKRHATSKLDTVADLERIATLGFRGEALASIAAVSRVTCTTRHIDEQIGTRLRIEGGTIVSQTPVGRPHGTEISIEDLFYNVPARRKFLRTERTERSHIDAFLTRYAIAYPNVAFQVMHNGREVLSTPGNDVASEAILQVYGMDLGGSLLEIPETLTAGQSLAVRGFVGPTTVHRADRGYITLFVNGRWIQDLRLTYAIIQAYHTLLPTKRYPVAFVMVTMPPEDVDTNVHPAKTEVRFRDGDAAFRAVQRAVRATVVNTAPAAASWQTPTSSTGTAQTTRSQLAALTPATRQITLPEVSNESNDRTLTPTVQNSGANATAATTQSPTTNARRGSELPPLRVIGQASTMVIIAEGPDGLYLIDQHAAHERVLYERILAKKTQGQVATQPLLEPETVSLPVDESNKLEEMLPSLLSLGLEVENFGPGTFLVRAVPAALLHTDIPELLADIAASIGERTPIHEELEEIIVRGICKRAAVKAGQVLSREEMERLVKDLEQTRNPRTCPHGRPTILQLPIEQLARQFGRGG